MNDRDLKYTSAAAIARPFFFMVPFWGERYRRYFVEILLPSLLAPHNLPLLRADQGHQFLIATTSEDWDAIIDLPIVKRLREHATPVLIEIPSPTRAAAPGSTNAILHQNYAQKLLVEAAFRSKAYGSLYSPDCIISDGAVNSLIGHVRAGHRLVLCPALRQTEESVIAELTGLGYLSLETSPARTGKSIDIPQRVLADLMVRYLHPEMAIFEEGALGQPPLAPFRYWRLPNEKGIILRTFHGAPMLMDFKAIDHHDVACLDRNSFEDVYVARNFGGAGNLHVVRDSDEFCILSLTPAAIGQMTAGTTSSEPVRSSEGFARRLLAALSISYCTAGMPLKKELFKQSVRWHGGDLDEAAIAQEGRISAFIESAVRYSGYTRLPAALLLSYRETPMLRRFLPYGRKAIRALLGDRLLRSYIRQRLSFEIRRPFKRALFWLKSGGKDLDQVDPFHFSFRRTAGRRIVNEALFSKSPTTAVILGIGQSNIANECDPSALYEPKNDVCNFNFFDGKCYVAKDPLLGAGNSRSNPLTRLGDLLIERGNYHRVLLVPIAHGGTYVRDWSPTGMMFPRLQWTLERLRERQLVITHIAWQQGEAEAAQSDPNPEEWVRHFMAMVDAIRATGLNAPIYVAQCTVCCNDPNERIRSAQRRVINRGAGVLAGPDIDLIGRDERYDGCHLSATGLQHAAALWCEALCPSGLAERVS